MGDTEFTARGVRIGRWLRSLTRAGQVRIKDGRLQLLTSLGREIDSAPVQHVHAARPLFAREGRAHATLNGHRYTLTLGPRNSRPGMGGPPDDNRFLEAVRTARARSGRT
ncbi:hypothetical protein [Streptomyces boninensis]|uniref:hypothetical protein n=1 Tax=Streptomyces boninensis TaxID=2039455 RepID=UPI003B221E32